MEMRFKNNEQISKDEFLQAVSEGVENAIWSMITNATTCPCIDFYETIQKAAESAFSKLHQSDSETMK